MPLRGVQWVPPAVWKKAVDGLHKPFARQHPRPLLWAPCCSLVGPVTGFVTSGLPLSPPFLCAPCYPHAGCRLPVQGCLCCCPLAGPTWWPPIRTSGVAAREPPEAELKPTAQLLPLETPLCQTRNGKGRAAAAQPGVPARERGQERRGWLGPPRGRDQGTGGLGLQPGVGVGGLEVKGEAGGLSIPSSALA